MRIGIGHKLVAMLVLTAVVPLLVALGVLTWEWRRLRLAGLGQHLLTAATAQASAMDGLLREDLAGAIAQAREAEWIGHLRAPRVGGPLSDRQAGELDEQWAGLGEESEPVAAVLRHPLAEQLRQFCRTHRRCREIFVTDARGYLLAASNKTSDFIQSDEPWWQEAYAGGRGAVQVSDVNYDASAGIWAIDVSVPVYAYPETSQEVIGVLREVLDLAEWVEAPRPMGLDPEARQMLVTSTGRVLFADGAPIDRLTVPVPPRVLGGGWVRYGELLRAYAPLHVGREVAGLPVTAPRWCVLVEAPAGAAVGLVDRMAWIALGAGVLVIAGAFVLGTWLFHRQIIWPLERLRASADRIALGDLTSRVEPARRLAPHDEIGQLTADFNRMAAEVERSYRALAVANETKDRFLHVASHELRTPVTYVVAMADLLSHRQADPGGREAFEKLRERAFQLERIVTGMFALLAEGRLAGSLRMTRFGAIELAEEVAGELRPFAEQRGQRIEVHRPAGPVPLTGDRGKLRDALANLVGNAIKFTPDGGTVAVACEGLDGRVAFHVTDQGQGIAEADLPHIFEAFWGGGEVLRHSSGEFGYQQRGPGLGLSIAQEFARLHGGGIQVRNTQQGCTFSLIVEAEPKERRDGS